MPSYPTSLITSSEDGIIMVALQPKKEHHFLLVVYPVQSHINPSLQLARALTRLGVQVTFSTAVSAHRRMFPGNSSVPLDDPSEPLLAFHPYSDGYDHCYTKDKDDMNDYMSSFRTVGSETLHAVATAPGRPAVTCVVYALLIPWAVDVAARLGVPSVLYWIQPAAVFAIYYNHFHGWPVHALSGLPLLEPRDLPSFISTGSSTLETLSGLIMSWFEETFVALERGAGERKPRVIVNTFGALEGDVMEAMSRAVELIPVGPLVPAVCLGREAARARLEKEVVDVATSPAMEECLEWLDGWPERSVVYVSMGSISVLERRQREELARAVVECRRPFLWVARGEREGLEEAEKVGKVVQWCEQGEVLAHRAVGCFVTHHGWNSTLEALTCGVPMVGMPQWSDQPTNARLVEGPWGVGVRAAAGADRVVEAGELMRCLDVVMESGEIRMKAEMWKEKAREAMGEQGPSDRNLKAFINSTVA